MKFFLYLWVGQETRMAKAIITAAELDDLEWNKGLLCTVRAQSHFFQ